MRKLLVAGALLAVTGPLIAQATGKGALGTVGALIQENNQYGIAGGHSSPFAQ